MTSRADESSLRQAARWQGIALASSEPEEALGHALTLARQRGRSLTQSVYGWFVHDQLVLCVESAHLPNLCRSCSYVWIGDRQKGCFDLNQSGKLPI
jgi:hypothetical protein